MSQRPPATTGRRSTNRALRVRADAPRAVPLVSSNPRPYYAPSADPSSRSGGRGKEAEAEAEEEEEEEEPQMVRAMSASPTMRAGRRLKDRVGNSKTKGTASASSQGPNTRPSPGGGGTTRGALPPSAQKYSPAARQTLSALQAVKPRWPNSPLSEHGPDRQQVMTPEGVALADTGRSRSYTVGTARRRHRVEDYELIAVIGKGGYGEVRVVRRRVTGEVLAMKTLVKQKMIDKEQVKHVRTERDLMVNVDNWLLVRLHLSFQDRTHLYFVMEYCPGGDLMKLLIKEDIFPEDVTRFYMSECARAIDVLHSMDYVHRDLKPDNILIARDGHIKLSDFGLAKHNYDEVSSEVSKWQSEVSRDMAARGGNLGPVSPIPPPTSPQSARNSADEKDGGGKDGKDKKKSRFRFKVSVFGRDNKKNYKRDRVLLYSAVGTPNYIAPEVLSKQGYGRECDWWSLGTIMFECLCGYPPFYHETPLGTCRKILRYREFLRIPKHCNLSSDAKHCIFKLICSPRKRMAFPALKKHPFFRKVPWHDMRRMRPPFVPRLKSDADTRYFDKVKDVDLELPRDEEDEAEAAAAAAAEERKDAEDRAFARKEKHKKRKSSFNNLDPKGPIRDPAEDLQQRDPFLAPDKRNHFYGFTFERIPDKKDIFAESPSASGSGGGGKVPDDYEARRS